MTAALLAYACTPDQVGIGTPAEPSRVGMTLQVSNKGKADVRVEQIAFTLPQGDGATDLLAPGTTFTAGSVRSSTGAAWTPSVAANQVVLLPVTQSFYTLAHGDTLQLTLSGVQVNAAGAGRDAIIAVAESIHDGWLRTAAVPVHKLQPHFHIAAFYLDQYNVPPGSPVTVTWGVVDALSCEVIAKVVEMSPANIAAPRAAACGVGTGTPSCTGTISSGTVLAGSHTCTVQGATVFTLTALGSGDQGDVQLTSQVLVTVNEPAIKFTVYPPDVSKGMPVTLKWIAADAGKLLLYTKPLEGQHSMTDLTTTPVGRVNEQPLTDTRFSLCAFGDANDTDPAQEIEQDVSVEQPAWKAPPVASGYPDPAFPGDTAELAWSVLNVDHCRISCDLPGFVPLDKLPAQGTQPVTLPDPGVATGNATFTVTPVELAGLGDFTPMTVSVPVTNTPHFERLVFDPDEAAPGADVGFTWLIGHADALTIGTNLPGDKPQAVDIKSGHAIVPMASLVIPTPIDYTLTASSQAGKYSSTLSVTVGCSGAATTIWCNSKSGQGNAYDYLYLINFQTPNQRIRKIGLQWTDGSGVTALNLWYSDAVAPDYVLTNGSQPYTTHAFLEIPAGDMLASMDLLFASDPANSIVGLLWYLKLTTAGGVSAEIGTTNVPGTADGPYHVAAPAGQQVIALSWNQSYTGLGVFCGLGAVCVSTTYGQ